MSDWGCGSELSLPVTNSLLFPRPNPRLCPRAPTHARVEARSHLLHTSHQVGLVQLNNSALADNGGGPISLIVDGKEVAAGFEMTYVVDDR